MKPSTDWPILPFYRLGKIVMQIEMIFAAKKAALQESGLEINRQIAAYKDWNIDSINKHQKWLARQAGRQRRYGRSINFDKLPVFAKIEE